MKRFIFVLFAFACFSPSIFAQERLHPVTQIEQQLWGKDDFEGWFDKEASQQLLIFPSFNSPSALYIKSASDAPRMIIKWKETTGRDENNLPITVTMADSISIDWEVAQAIGNLIQHAVGTSMHVGERYGLDGTRYFLFDRYNVATTWSPEGNVGKLIEVLDGLMYATGEHDPSKVEALLPAIDSLTLAFKKLYPDDFYKPTASYYKVISHPQSQTISLLACEGRFRMDIPYPVDADGEKARQECLDRYGKLAEEVGRELFIGSSFFDKGFLPLDKGEVVIRVDDTKPQGCQKDYTTTICTVKKKDLNKKRLLQLIGC